MTNFLRAASRSALAAFLVSGVMSAATLAGDLSPGTTTSNSERTCRLWPNRPARTRLKRR